MVTKPHVSSAGTRLPQLEADAVHLRGMKQGAFFRPLVLERDGSCMQGIMTALAQGQQIRFLIASLRTSEDDVMYLQASILRFSSTVLASVPVSREDVGFGVGKTVVDALLVEPLVLQDLWMFQGMRVKGSCFQHHGGDRQERLHKADFSQMGVDLASHGR